MQILGYHLLQNKDTYVVPQKQPLIIVDCKSDMYISNNGKDTKHTRHIGRRLTFVRHCEKYKQDKIDWCEGGLELADIATKTFKRMIYIPE